MTSSDIERLVSAQVTNDRVLSRAVHLVISDRHSLPPLLSALKPVVCAQLVAMSLGQAAPEIDWTDIDRQCRLDIWHPWDMFLAIREVNPSASYSDIFGHPSIKRRYPAQP